MRPTPPARCAADQSGPATPSGSGLGLLEGQTLTERLRHGGASLMPSGS
jgi:hypothetical protein